MANCYLNEYGSNICQTDNWIFWGRWVLLAAGIVLIIAIYLIFACITARRRHKSGVKPYIGTQWALGRNPPQYNSTETLPTYCAANNNSNDRDGSATRDVEAQPSPEAAHMPIDRVDRK